jgi:hypothetical protein
MRVVIDTVIISRITRKPRRTGHKTSETVLDAPIRARKLIIVVDNSLALIDEWRKTAGDEAVRRIVETWDTRTFHVVRPASLGSRVSRRLSQLKFIDTVDRLIVRIALGLDDDPRNICSGDSDFWNPSVKRSVGDRRAVVATLLRDQHHIEVHSLPQLLELLLQKN